MTFFRAKYLQKKFTSILFFLLLGFLVGNLFGTILNQLRELLVWDGFIVILLLFLIEVVSYANYNSINLNRLIYAEKSYPLFFRAKNRVKTFDFYNLNRNINKLNFTIKNSLFFNWGFIRLVNVFKIGLMIGFFVDAFKVGS